MGFEIVLFCLSSLNIFELLFVGELWPMMVQRLYGGLEGVLFKLT